MWLVPGRGVSLDYFVRFFFIEEAKKVIGNSSGTLLPFVATLPLRGLMGRFGGLRRPPPLLIWARIDWTSNYTQMSRFRFLYINRSHSRTTGKFDRQISPRLACLVISATADHSSRLI
jgi:hypothetical protein